MQFRVVATLLLACLVGFLLRATNLDNVFPPDGVLPSDGLILLGVDDSYFHARRALYTFENFPTILEFDHYLAYPRGAAQPSPPLHDWLIAGTARLLGNDLRTFELVAAWIPPVLSALFALSAFWIAAFLAGARTGLVASWFVAVLPAGALITSLGNCDHHAMVALLASFWVAASLRELRTSGMRLFVHGLLHAAIVTALVLTWSGSLLYVAIGEGARLVTILLCRPRQERFFAMAGSDLVAAAVVSSWLLQSAAPLGGPLSSQTLSWLHPIALLSVGALAAALGALERFWPTERPTTRLGRAVLIGSCLALPSLAVPEIRDALATGLGFIGKGDVWAETNPEQMPLFHDSKNAASATTRFGYLVYTIPLLPLLVARLGFRARRESRDQWLLVFLWMLSLCALSLTQIRYATDFAVLAAVGFALLLNEVHRQLTRGIGRRLSLAFTAVLGLVVLIPAYSHFAPRISLATTHLFGGEVANSSARLRATWTTYAFARMVREATPETMGFLDETRTPEYGVLVPPTKGHLFTYIARRPVPANNLGPYLDRDLFQRARSFYKERRPGAALEILEALQVRYFVTMLRGFGPGTFAAVAHRFNDSAAWARDRPSTGRIRLVAEGPPNGRPFTTVGPRGNGVEVPAYKLFEVVEGAVFVGETEPNARATAELTLTTPLGRTRYRALGWADASGQLELRVPYPSEAPDAQRPMVHALGRWRVELGGDRYEVTVTEIDVREGREIRLEHRNELSEIDNSQGTGASASSSVRGSERRF
jgi:asparagine N-glycosylation enzyme membrane subunit Stt3